MGITDQRVLVLDGGQRVALSVTRSLGRRGIVVITADHAYRSIAGASRFCAGSIAITSPWHSIGQFQADVARAARVHDCVLVMPLTDASLTALHQAEGTKEWTAASSSRTAYATASDKAESGRLLMEWDIAVPEGVECLNAEEIAAAIAYAGYPAAVKPNYSLYIDGDHLCGTRVSIIRSSRELALVMKQPWLGRVPCMVQRVVPGRGAGVFALAGGDGPIVWFAHRRLREKPPGGGVSVLSESVPVAPRLRAAAEGLLRHLNWFGPAMVEFRVDPHGKPWFMEVNGRFWGSLQLAIDCGVDFPWLFYQLCLGRAVDPIPDYAVGRRLRWEVGDLDHLLLQLRGKGTAGSAAEKLRALCSFLNPVAGRPEVFRLDDPRPFFHELRTWIAGLRR